MTEMEQRIGRQISRKDFDIVFSTGNFAESPRIEVPGMYEGYRPYSVAHGTMKEPREKIWCKVYDNDDERNGLVE